MTERNPLMNRPRSTSSAPPFVTVYDQQVPTGIYDYCAWLNAKEHRRGIWAVIGEEGKRTVEWREEVASDDWLRERGLAPKIGRAA
jgi:hypothetical protein